MGLGFGDATVGVVAAVRPMTAAEAAAATTGDTVVWPVGVGLRCRSERGGHDVSGVWVAVRFGSYTADFEARNTKFDQTTPRTSAYTQIAGRFGWLWHQSNKWILPSIYYCRYTSLVV